MGELNEAFSDVAQKTEQAVAKDFTGAYQKILKETEEKTTQVAENAATTEAGHVRTLEELRGRIGGSETPVYRMRDDRVIERLGPEGPQALTQEDRDRLGLKLDDQDRVPQRPTGKKSPYNLPDKPTEGPRPRTDSTPVPLGSTDLAEATQLARHEDGSYGNYTKEKGFQSNNYAAVRYGKEGDPNGFILVGRSRNPVHSERILGIPFKQSGREGGLTQLYTEREPCTTGPNCSAWMDHHLPSGVAVSHSVEYGTDPSSQAAGNAAMENYLNRLWPKAPRSPK